MREIIKFSFLICILALLGSMGESFPSNNSTELNFGGTFNGNLTKKEGRGILFPIYLLKWTLLKVGKLNLLGSLLNKLAIASNLQWIPTQAPQTTTRTPITSTDSPNVVSTTPRTPPTPPTPPSNSTPITCTRKNELLIIVDESGSVDDDQFLTALQFTADLASAWRDFDDNRVGIGFFADTTRTLIRLQDSSSLDSSTIYYRILRATQMGGGTAIHSALDYADQLFTQVARDDVPANIVLITDGGSDLNLIKDSAQRYFANRNRYAYVVGIGGGVNYQQLLAVTGGKPERVFHLSDFSELLHTLRAVSVAVCKQ